jgi:hypothetical protein
MALKNPEHPGCSRGFGVVPWKFAFRGDIATYQSRRRRREREETVWKEVKDFFEKNERKKKT